MKNTPCFGIFAKIETEVSPLTYSRTALSTVDVDVIVVND